MRLRDPLPAVFNVPFLAGNGFVGVRCDCGYVATGRTIEAIDSALRDHQHQVHGESLQDDADAGVSSDMS